MEINTSIDFVETHHLQLILTLTLFQSKNPQPQFATIEELIQFKKGRKFAPGQNVSLLVSSSCEDLSWLIPDTCSYL